MAKSTDPARAWLRAATALCVSLKRSSAQPELLECLADPGTLVLARLQALRLHQGIGVLVPAAVREVVAEHGGGGLRLGDNAERQVSLGQPQQRFLDVAGGLVAGDPRLAGICSPEETGSARCTAAAGRLLHG